MGVLVRKGIASEKSFCSIIHIGKFSVLKQTFSLIDIILKILYSIEYKYERKQNTHKMQSSNTSSSSGAFGNNKNVQHSGVSSSGSQTSTQEQKSFNAQTNFIQSWFGSQSKQPHTQQQTNTKKGISWGEDVHYII